MDVIMNMNMDTDTITVKVGDDDEHQIKIKHIIGSKVIMDVLTCSGVTNEPIPIGVTDDSWFEYMSFLNDHTFSISALKVIDYLDNVEQARLWTKYYCGQIFKDKYKQRQQKQHNECKQEKEKERKEGKEEEKVKFTSYTKYEIQYLINIIMVNTGYDSAELLPVRYLTNFDMIVKRMISNQGMMSKGDVMYLVMYYNSKFNDSYRFIEVTPILDNISQELLQVLITNKFILMSTDGSVIHCRPDIILQQFIPAFRPYKMLSNRTAKDMTNSYRYTLTDGVSYISPRVAGYYSDIKTITISEKTALIITSDNDIYTKQTSNLSYYIVGCQSTKYYDNKYLMKSNNNYNPNSQYKPNIGFQTGVKLNDYTVLSYNVPSLYDRNYYTFLPQEYDPIAKIVYAFSV